MFRFVELKLHNWDLWKEAHVPLDRNVVVLTGANGSGKTTLLDAIRQLLGAPKLSRKRKLHHYLREPHQPAILRAVVTNTPNASGRRPFQGENMKDDEVTLACSLRIKADGSPDKRWAILAGRATLEQVINVLMEGKGDVYEPRRYEHALEDAGVTKSLMQVLAIEQGTLDALAGDNPRQLFGRVLEMLGDQATLKRYQETRETYYRAEKELLHQKEQLTKALHEFELVRMDVRRLEEHEEAEAKVEELKDTVPAAELQAALKEREQLGQGLPGMRKTLLAQETRKKQLEDRMERIDQDREQLASHLEVASGAESKAREAWGAVVKELGQAEERVQFLEDRQHQLEKLPTLEPRRVREELEAATRERIRLELGHGDADAKEADLRRKLADLQAGRPAYPVTVRTTLDALERKGIQAVLAAAAMELMSPSSGSSAEAALADARFALLVQPAHLTGAIDIARQFKFPGPVYAGDRLTEEQHVGPFRFMPGSPSWLLTWAKEVDLREDGSWRDSRGHWLPRETERVVGRAGIAAALDRAKDEHKLAERQVRELGNLLSEAKETEEGARERYEQASERERILKEIEGLPAAKEDIAKLNHAVAEAKQTFDEASKAHHKVERELQDKKHAWENDKRDVDDADREISRLTTAIATSDQRISTLDGTIRDLETRIRADLLERARQGQLDGVATVKVDLEKAEQRLAKMPPPPKPTVRTEAELREKNIATLRNHLAEREDEQAALVAELSEARGQYLQVVDEALRAYKKRVEALARFATNVAAEVTLPKLANDDDVLDEAGIEIAFSFDGKPLLSLGDSSFSDGQRVITGLIVLMAMSEAEESSQGFFMLDEPFAHLSMDRIDDVGRFLRATQAQFILTAPTMPNRAQLDPASLVIALRKKPSGERYAPVPMVAVA